jgi:uncharacterized protein (DUF934 family)
MPNTIELIAPRAVNTPANGQNEALNVLKISNDSDVATQAQALSSAEVVELHFPAFSDGRAFSQAVQLRKRLGFKGDIRAFTSAVLREDQSAEHATKLLTHYKDFYQGDVANRAAFIVGKFNAATGKLA